MGKDGTFRTCPKFPSVETLVASVCYISIGKILCEENRIVSKNM